MQEPCPQDSQAGGRRDKREEWGTAWGAPGRGEKPHSSLGRAQGAFVWEAHTSSSCRGEVGGLFGSVLPGVGGAASACSRQRQNRLPLGTRTGSLWEHLCDARLWFHLPRETWAPRGPPELLDPRERKATG